MKFAHLNDLVEHDGDTDRLGWGDHKSADSAFVELLTDNGYSEAEAEEIATIAADYAARLGRVEAAQLVRRILAQVTITSPAGAALVCALGCEGNGDGRRSFEQIARLYGISKQAVQCASRQVASDLGKLAAKNASYAKPEMPGEWLSSREASKMFGKPGQWLLDMTKRGLLTPEIGKARIRFYRTDQLNEAMRHHMLSEGTQPNKTKHESEDNRRNGAIPTEAAFAGPH